MCRDRTTSDENIQRVMRHLPLRLLERMLGREVVGRWIAEIVTLQKEEKNPDKVLAYMRNTEIAIRAITWHCQGQDSVREAIVDSLQSLKRLHTL
jgi:hypothetical protein